MIKNNKGIKENEIKEIESWRNEHGDPDFAYLESIALTGTIEAVNKLKSIAEDLDIDIDPSSSSDDIVKIIRMNVGQNEDGNLKEIN